MKAFKLLKKRNDKSLGPLFINCRQRIPIGEWLDAESHPRKGYALRPGWHVTLDPIAPHLVMNGRIWCEVEVDDYVVLKRPESQGTTWILAKKMKVIKERPDLKHEFKGK